VRQQPVAGEYPEAGPVAARLSLPFGLPGAIVNTSATNYEPVKFLELERFDGTSWEPVKR